MKHCKHPKTRITMTNENSYTDEGYGCDRYVKVLQWKCTKCNEVYKSNLTHCDNYICYKEFTGRDYKEDFKRELKVERVKKARVNLKRAEKELKEALKD